MNDNSTEDKEVVRIAERIAEAEDADIPSLLIGLRDLLEKHPSTSEESKILKKSIWKYDLLSWCAVSLRYDYSKIYGGLEMATGIAYVLCECCCSLNVNESQEFSQFTLPSALQSFLSLLRLLQQRIADGVKKPSNQSKTDSALADDLFSYLTSIVTSFPHLCKALVSSNNLLRLVMDDGKISLSAITLIKRVIIVNRFCLPQISQGNMHAMLDELVYKLTSSESEELAAASTRLILSMCDAHGLLVPVIVTRFKGLKAILGRWDNRGFDRELARLAVLFEAGSAQKAQLARQRNAATTIWAFYKGWKTRKQLKTVKRAIPTLQRSFRRKLRGKAETEEKEKSVRLQRSEAEREKRKSFRKIHEKQLHSLEILPAGKVTKHLQNEETFAAIRIQAHWRAHAQRKAFKKEQRLQKNNTAAVTIQRHVRKYFNQKQPIKSLVDGDSILEKSTKADHQQTIDRWQAVHKRVCVPRAEVEKNHELAQNKLVNHLRKKIVEGRESHKIDGLLARIHTEESTLSHLPPLADADKDTIDQLACNSLVIQRAALIEHTKQTNLLNQPWWKRLNSDNDEQALNGW